MDNETRQKIKGEMLQNITFANDATWEPFLEDDKLTLFFFMSTTNLACRSQIPKIVAFARQMGDKYNVVVMDYDQSPQAVEICEVDGTPMMVFMRQGIIMGGRRGGLPHEHELKEFSMQLDQLQKVDMDYYVALNGGDEMQM